MTLEDKVNKIVGEIMTAHASDLHKIVRIALEEQDRYTRHACQDEISEMTRVYRDSLLFDEIIAACQNANPWK